ncbi:hypothetical protein SDC9_168825 [bioreactor metagenome]|uniref:Uncharacterized protein n=1 Tax=bioreactor metagenome TaxID=1076179 RepID=A0A645G5P6_9ZZZZ
MRSDQSSQGERVILDERYCLPILRAFGVWQEIDAFQLCIDTEVFHPSGKDFHDGGFCRGDTNEIHGRLFSGGIDGHCSSPFAIMYLNVCMYVYRIY